MTDLVDRAHSTRVVVIGAGVSGLVAAFECARLGLAVTVLEKAPRPGGLLASVDLDGLRVDLAAEGFSGGARATRHLATELGLDGDIVESRADELWLSTAAGPVPPPADTVIGIPANPWAVDVRRVIGWSGVWRAYLDRLRPPLTIGHRRSLGEIVRSRMGDAVHDRLVAPRTLGVYGVDPTGIDVDAAAPGLNTALTRTGSLSGAVGQILRSPRPRWSLRGGPARLVDALVDRLGHLEVQVRTDAAVRSLASTPTGAWRVTLTGADAGQDDAGQDDADVLEADLVIVATPERAARDLIEPIVALPEPVAVTPAAADIVLLRVAAPLPARGAGVYGPAESPAVVRCLSAAWDDWDDALGVDEHLLRVVLPAPGADSAAPHDRAAVVEDARSTASTLLGVDIPQAAVRAAHVVRVDRAAPASVLGHGADAAAVRAAVATLPGLAVVGEWVAGSGVEQSVADATAEADRARHTVLWSDLGGA